MITNNMNVLMNSFVSNGYEIRFVGGCVRDYLMGVTPKDFDFATTATPDQMVDLCERVGLVFIPTGLQHGTITIVVGGESFEVTTLRIDAETDGRHAKVEYTTNWKVDASRRDFTINALSMDRDGKVYDYFGGTEDLKTRTVRFVGDADQRIREDYLRILRYFRFRSRLGVGGYVSDDMIAICRNVGGLRQISGERIWMEMKKIFASNNLLDTLLDMDDSRVLKTIGINLSITDAASAAFFTENPIARLASGLRYVYDKVVSINTIVNEWKVSADERDQLLFLVNSVGDPKRWATRIKKPGWAVDLAVVQMEYGLAQEMREWSVPSFPIMGRDLIAKGMTPGKEMGVVLSQLRNEWEDSEFKLTKDDLLKGVNV